MYAFVSFDKLIVNFYLKLFKNFMCYMIKCCTKCKSSPNIKINMLSYCNVCFKEQLFNKVFKQIHKITPSSNVLIILKNSPESPAFCDILNKFFKKRLAASIKLITNSIETFQNNELEICKVPFQLNHNIMSDDMINYCKINFIDIVIYSEILEDIISRSLGLICAGNGHGAIHSAHIKQHEDIHILNPFFNIKEKEIMYYMHIENIKRQKVDTRIDKTHITLRRFLHDIDSRNSLALFNISNTLKKL